MFVRRLVISTVFSFAFVIVALPGATSSGISKNTLSAQSAPFSLTDTPDEPSITTIFALVNAERHANNISPLVADKTLTELAQIRANDMANNRYYGHRDSNNNTFGDILRASGKSMKHGCENLDLQFVSEANRYVSDWMESNRGHRECLLNPKTSKAGYAVVEIAPYAGEAVKTYIVVAIHSIPPLPIQ